MSATTPGNGTLARGRALSRGPTLAPLDAETVRAIGLDAVEAIVPIAPGIRYRASTYGGQVPGPTIHVRQGDHVSVRLNNRARAEAPVVQSITVHGSQIFSPGRHRSIGPGQSLSFEFQAGTPNVFMYHSATPMVLERVADGQFGAFVLEPRDGWPTRADHAYVLVQSELYAQLPAAAGSALAQTGIPCHHRGRFVMAPNHLAKCSSEVQAMNRDLQDLFLEAVALPDSERATLAGLLIESLEPPPDADVEEAWTVEAQRRWHEIETGAVETVRWEEVRARLFQR